MKFRHRKRGSEYTLFDIIDSGGVYLTEGAKMTFYELSELEPMTAEVQSSMGPFKNMLVALYYCNKTGKDYCRPAVEFFDGRFERI